MLLILAVPRAAGRLAAVLTLVLVAGTLGGYERVREVARKPFVLAGYMYSNGIRVNQAERVNREGLLAAAHWAGIAARPIPAGEQVFRAQCQACHSVDGYLAIRPLVAGQDADGLAGLLDALRGGRPGMPAILGTDAEVRELANFLASLGATGGGAQP